MGIEIRFGDGSRVTVTDSKTITVTQPNGDRSELRYQPTLGMFCSQQASASPRQRLEAMLMEIVDETSFQALWREAARLYTANKSCFDDITEVLRAAARMNIANRWELPNEAAVFYLPLVDRGFLLGPRAPKR